MSKQNQQQTEKVQAKQRAVSDSTPSLQRTLTAPHILTSGNASILQRTIGNQALRRLSIQRKMTVGPVGDKYEQEADAVAKQVLGRLNTLSPQTAPTQIAQRQEEEELQMSPLVQRQEEEELQMKSIQRQEEGDELQMKPLPSISSLQRQEEEELQMKPLVQRQEEEELQAKGDSMLAGGELSGDVESSVQRAKSGGQPLSDNIRTPMEQAFNADFSGVKVHTGSQSDHLNRSLSARAFTSGQDVFFRQGEYNPGSSTGQELLAHELTHVVQQKGQTVQRKALDADTILNGVPTALAGNSLLPEGGELKLDTILFGDKTLKGRIEDIISTYEAQFQKDESATAVTHNAQKVLAAFQTIGMVIARKLHMGQEGHKISKALLASQKDRLITALKKNTSETKESNALSDTDATAALKMAQVMAGDDPVGMYVQDKTSLKKADASIRAMATELKQTPLEVFELLRQQFESRIGSLTLQNVKDGELDDSNTEFPLKDLYGEVSVNFFENLLDLDDGGKAKWGDTGIEKNSAPKEWEGKKRTFRLNDLNTLRVSVTQKKDDTEVFAIGKSEQTQKGWDRLNNSQMEYLTDVEDKEGSLEDAAKRRMIAHYTGKGIERESAIEKMNAGVQNLGRWPITLTTKAQDMVKGNGTIVDMYKPFFSIFQREERMDKHLPGLQTDSTVKIIEDVLGRGLDYGQERKEKDEQQIGFDSPISLTDMPAMACINHQYEVSKAANYYGDTHFVLDPEVRKRSVFNFGTDCPERRSLFLVLDDVLTKLPTNFEQICDGNYIFQDVEVHVYGNIDLRRDIVEFHLGNPNTLVEADDMGVLKEAKGTTAMIPGGPLQKLTYIKQNFPEAYNDLKAIWIKKQKGTEKLKELIRTLPETVQSNIEAIGPTQDVAEQARIVEQPVVAPTTTATTGKKKRKGPCYITTACIRARGLEDDCEDLETLRYFRDEYLLKQPSGMELVLFYYEQAPKIVEALDQSPDSDTIYEVLYQVIRRCVKAIHAEKNQEAFDTYVNMVLKLRDQYTPSMDVPESMIEASSSFNQATAPVLSPV